MVHSSDTYAAVILAGGRASRLGGIDKTGLLYAGHTLLDHAIAAVAGAARTVVVGQRGQRIDGAPDSDSGSDSEHPSPYIRVQDREAFGGPAAALDTGLRALAETPAPWTVVLSADLPLIEFAMPTLLAARHSVAADVDGYLGRDPHGQQQFLLACYRTDALADALAVAASHQPLAGSSMKRVLAPLRLLPVDLRAEWSADIDTPDDAARYGISLATTAESASPSQEGAYAR